MVYWPNMLFSVTAARTQCHALQNPLLVMAIVLARPTFHGLGTAIQPKQIIKLIHQLARAPKHINVGELVRVTETSFNIAEVF